MKVYVLVEDGLHYGFSVIGIYTSEEEVNIIREEKMKPYKFDVSQYYKVHEVELNKEIDDIYYYE